MAISGKNNQQTFADLNELKNNPESPLQDRMKNFITIKNTDNIDEWMQIADIIVSKAGGLTISEAMYLQKPIIIVNPIPGQEDYNTAYLEKNRFGLKAHSSEDLAKKIQTILLDPNIITKKPRRNASEIILNKIFSA